MPKLPKAFKKRIPPPPRQPGTHTNAEVKEALHARALRRTIVVSALVVLLFASLGVVSSIAQDYTDEEDTTSSPKMLIITATNLSPAALSKTVSSNKAPFTRLLSTLGGIHGTVKRMAQQGDATLAKLLSGDATATSINIEKTFISAINSGEKKHTSVVVVPKRVEEETTLRGSDGTVETCESPNDLLRYQISQVLAKSLDKDLIYVQLDGLNLKSVETIEVSMRVRSEMNMLDNAIGQIGLLLSQRTKTVKENWYIMLVGQGENAATSIPFFGAVYTRGELVRLRPLSAEASQADVYGTVLRWFGVNEDTYKDKSLGICSNGINVVNCPK
ncbi:hypothetical protein AGDE_04276 [Angomonas deanei]|uniref:Uncharacterized protein n=1 Tax=Angomonas deanei TaxID=59799 RepID=S9UXL6_9TRYP|nr:hypothetical protein AGDE_11945 [Angomonas deanei]EPY33583.1 hypothetical protein AGDE_08211 [Angomonas deanei]EPY39652.1 hypothetical protein AGDE_04276 [Angomonas deanei]CAD2215035.1 hypothetical protein, conserved [Angomonas deanei]|eukprot:EPY25250.1 hypothetical protein AGDE_11945 [Angomonas deanei]